MVIPDLPAIPCPEPGCGHLMDLKPKPSHYIRHHTHPFWYVCRRPGCWGNIWAHKNGQPMGTPVCKEGRLLRKEAHSIIDKLWNKKGRSYAHKTRERAIIYLYMANLLDLPPAKVHLGRITDLDLLRQIIEIARQIDRIVMFKWWNAEGRHRYRIEEGLTQPIA